MDLLYFAKIMSLRGLDALYIYSSFTDAVVNSRSNVYFVQVSLYSKLLMGRKENNKRAMTNDHVVL